MIRALPGYAGHRGVVHLHVATLHAYNRNKLVGNLDTMCMEFAGMVGERPRQYRQTPRGWAVIDRAWKENPAGSQRVSISTVDFLLDLRPGAVPSEHCFLLAMVNLYDPEKNDLLDNRREAYQQWLLREFIVRWRVATARDPHLWMPSCGTATFAWVCGDPGNRVRADASGSVVAELGPLDEAEEYYVNPSVVSGLERDQTT